MSVGRNLLIVVASGLRSDALADERSWPLETPGLCKLAAKGLRAVATSACPTEPGGLVSLFTGLHARQHGRIHPDDNATIERGLPAWLSEARYHVAGVGCVEPFADDLHEAVLVQSLNDPAPAACDYFRYLRAQGYGPAAMAQRKQRLRCGPFEPDRLLLEPDDDIDGFIALEARKMLEKLPSDRPWALIVVFSGPGNDLPAPLPYGEIVEPEILEDGFTPADLRRLDVLAEPAYPWVMLQRLEPHAVARIRADYLGRVALIDRSVTRIVDDAMRRSDRQRTWTVVTSDSGYLLGEHGLVGRRSFLAGAVEVPVIVAPPPGVEVTPSRGDACLFSTVDVAATLAALAGADLTPAAAGAARSMLPLLSGEPVPPAPGGILSEFNGRLMLETERFKTVFDVESRRCLGVFDLLNDPDEMRNLSAEAVGQNLLDALRLRLADALVPLRAGPA